MKKSILKIFIVLTITSLILLFFVGCKSPDTNELEERLENLELEEKIEELEEELAEKEAEEAAPEEEEEEVTEDITDTEEMEEEEDGEEESGDGDADADSDADTDIEVPTISLAIYEGPTLDGSICYYRIQATVTGSPTVSFSKDDSGGAWGSKKVQINLNSPGDTYSLTATATNSEGSATDSIVLSWGCLIPPIEEDVNIGADNNLSGHIIVDIKVYTGAGFSLVGDYPNDKPIISFLSFNISSISGLDDVTIKNASVTIPVDYIKNNPEMAGSLVNIWAYDYGSSLEYADLGLGGELIETKDTKDSLTNLNFSGGKLEDELQKAVNIDKNWFQLALGLNGGSSNSTADWYKYLTDDVVLHIKYEVPG